MKKNYDGCIVAGSDKFLTATTEVRRRNTRCLESLDCSLDKKTLTPKRSWDLLGVKLLETFVITTDKWAGICHFSVT